jgi:monovalent cation:H+ antiporter-2, CPA2 family
VKDRVDEVRQSRYQLLQGFNHSEGDTPLNPD